MALPEITVPAGTPIFLVAGHQIEEADQFANVPRQRGHSRKRRVYTVSERIVDVAWILTRAQMVAVDAWFENTLQAGNRFFAAQVANQDAHGRLWWQAKWLEPYLSEPLHRGYWRVTGRLFLVGEGSSTGPVSTSLVVDFGIQLTGSATLTVGKGLTLDIVVALQQPLRAGSVDFGIELLPESTIFGRITEDDIERETEDGTRRITEDA